MPVTPPSKPSPPDLRIVQDTVNSKDLEAGVDVWSDVEGLRGWLEAEGLAPVSPPSPRDLRRAVRFREALRAVLSVHNGVAEEPTAAATIHAEAHQLRLRIDVARDGSVALAPRLHGVDGLVERVITAMLVASLDGRWERLKACANPDCRYAFYDATKNRSGRWCTMRLCGSQIASRSYRARRRAAAPG